MATQIHSYRKHIPFGTNGICFYQHRQWLTMLVVLLSTTILVSCGAKQDNDATKNDTTTVVENVSARNVSNTVVYDNENSTKVGNSNPFYLLYQAFNKTKGQLWSVLELLLIILLMLSVILYISEHIAQLNVYKRFIFTLNLVAKRVRLALTFQSVLPTTV